MLHPVAAAAWAKTTNYRTKQNNQLKHNPETASEQHHTEQAIQPITVKWVGSSRTTAPPQPFGQTPCITSQEIANTHCITNLFTSSSTTQKGKKQKQKQKIQKGKNNRTIRWHAQKWKDYTRFTIIICLKLELVAFFSKYVVAMKPAFNSMNNTIKGKPFFLISRPRQAAGITDSPCILAFRSLKI